MKKILLSLLLVALFAGAGILVFYPEAAVLQKRTKKITQSFSVRWRSIIPGFMRMARAD